jgi:S-DNA-T family DNA segregation ATPase FtsK/SpoIIIE
MAGASRLAMRSSLLPDGAGDFLRRRSIEIAGLALILFAIFVALTFITYSSSDPSLSHATSAPARNLGGRWGAFVADILLQTLGLGAGLLVATLAAWGFRLMRVHYLPVWWLRLSLLPVAVLLASLALAFVPPPSSWSSFINIGLGGVVGHLFFVNTVALAQKVGMGADTFGVLAAILSGAALFFALAITWGEWRAMGRFCMATAATAAAVTRRVVAWRPRLGDQATWRKQAKVAKRREPKVAGGDDDDIAVERDIEPVEPRRPPPADLVAPRNLPEAPAKKAAPKKQSSLDLRASGKHKLPPLDLLVMPKISDRTAAAVDENALAQNARLLESVLDDFGVKGQIVKVRPGPVVTLYELEPAPGTKTSRVIGLADDIARSMSAVSVRVAVIPGRNVIGIELPNISRETVFLRELLAADDSNSAGALALYLGKDIGGTPINADLSRMPHLLIAGTTGSGKSVAINTMILSILYRLAPADCRFIMVDPKMLELSVYDGIPHLLAPVVTDPKKAVVALKWAVREMENRYRAMSKLGVRNITGYNARLAEAKKKGEVLLRKVQTGFDEEGKPIFEDQPLNLEPLPFIVVVIDEMADLMLVAGKDVEWAVQRLAQMARAAGIHLIMATQRPSVDVITGTIKANFPTRISFQVTSKIDSRTILGEQGAEQLLGQGDMLYMAGGGRITRVHGPFVSDREVEHVVKYLKDQGEPLYVEEVTEDEAALASLGNGGPAGDAGGGSGDGLYDQAVALVARERKCSTSFIQRHLQIGYNRAARIVERMEAEGVVSTANHVGKREVIAPKGDYAG